MCTTPYFKQFLELLNWVYKKTKDRKNIPEMNVSEPDLIPVKILSKSVEKQKSYSILTEGPFFC